MGHQLLQWKRVVVHGSCASDLRQSGRPDRPEACLYVKIGTVINVYPVGVPGAKKNGQNTLKKLGPNSDPRSKDNRYFLAVHLRT